MNNNKSKFSRFERINSNEIGGAGISVGRYELQEESEINNDCYIGEFLSKMWAIYGEAEVIYEGFQYSLKDKETGLIFHAGFANFGPGYLGFTDDFEKIKSVAEEIEKLIKDVEPADCELDTDFGPFIAGAKDGIPYDRPGIMEG
ncbi:MAG: hypothetical protein AB6733_14965 [Clostridiaceae bacterium]